MKNFQAVYYRYPAGVEPVRVFVDALDEDAQVAIENQIDRLNLLNDSVPHLPFPHSSQIDGEFRELRAHYGSTLYRVLYRRSGRLIILLHVFTKKSARVPKAEIKVAKDRWADFKARMDAVPNKPPRAAGHDAP